jgi:hypothetical protein
MAWIASSAHDCLTADGSLATLNSFVVPRHSVTGSSGIEGILDSTDDTLLARLEYRSALWQSSSKRSLAK